MITQIDHERKKRAGVRGHRPTIETVRFQDQDFLLVRENGTTTGLKVAVAFLVVLLAFLGGLHLELRLEVSRTKDMQAAYGYSVARALGKVGVHFDPETGESYQTDKDGRPVKEE